MKIPSMKCLVLATALVSIASVSAAGPIAPVVDPLAGALSGTPLSMLTDQLSALDEQLGALSGGGLPGAESLPIDPANFGGGDNPVQPVLDQLTGLSGGDNPLAAVTGQLPSGGGDDPLASLTDQLPAGGEGGANPLAEYAIQLSLTVDTLADDVAGSDGTVDAITDVLDTLVTDPSTAEASIEAVAPTIETAVANFQANLMALSGSEEEGGNGGGDAPDFSLVLTTPAGVLTVDSAGPSFE